MEMKIAIVVANCCKDSKVAVDYNTGWNPYLKKKTIGQTYTVFDWNTTEEL